MKKYLFIGAGNMAYAIVNSMKDRNIFIYDKTESQYDKFDKSKVTIAQDLKDAINECDYIIFAIKPQNFCELCQQIKSYDLDLQDKIFVSIAAGVSCQSIEKNLGAQVAIIRTMPNTPLLIGKGVTAISKNERVNDEAYKEISNLFSASGKVLFLPEEKMNAVISVISSSPAYVYYFIDCILKGAIEQGIDTPNTLEIICEMVKGSADMIIQSGKNPGELIDLVCSKGGTTEKAMNVLYDKKLSETISLAMDECTKRAKELSALF